MRTRSLVVAGSVALLSACGLHAGRGARVVPTTPAGLPLVEQALRSALVAGSWDDAVARATDPQRGAPGDPLLRALYEGTTAYYASRWRESAAAFDRAATLADERVTWRLSRGALALASNDRALPYVPGENERLLAHQYAMLAYLQARDHTGAAVEARRIGALLERADTSTDAGERATHAVLRYLSGVAFEMAGEREDAEVAYRNARTLGAADTTARATQQRRPRGASATGEVVLLVERGFVAHRVSTRLRVRVPRPDDDDDAADVERLAAQVGRALQDDGTLWADALPPVLTPPPSRDGDAARTRRTRATALLALAWPAFRRTGRLDALDGVVTPTDLVVRTVAAWRGLGAHGAAATPVLLRADLSDAMVADFRRDRRWLVTRLVARTALRQALVTEARRRARPLGDLLAAAGSFVEQADTRSWHLLPARLEVVRLRLPVGSQPLSVDVGGRAVPLGVVDVRADGLTFFPVRLWESAAPAPAVRLANAGI
ncbi:MAG: hypothetical protein ACXW0Z_10825 [Gemmatirosa sp.]